MLILLILLFTVAGFAQNNPTAKYKDETLRISWDYDTTGTVFDYYVFAVRGNDTTLFRTVAKFYEGSKYDSCYGFRVASTVYNYYHFELKNITPAEWIRFGVMGVGNGQVTDSLRVTNYLRIRKPVLPGVIKID